MSDVLTPAQRRYNMSRIRGKNTVPEMIVRRVVHGMGYRYRLHRRDLPGHPDLVFPARRQVIFVHGCFWHRHACRFGSVRPRTNAEFWEEKISGNVARDKRATDALAALGWKAGVVWECETRDPDALRRSLRAFLRSSADASGRLVGRSGKPMTRKTRRS